MATELGWSHRRLISRFREQVGLTPKLLASDSDSIRPRDKTALRAKGSSQPGTSRIRLRLCRPGSPEPRVQGVRRYQPEPDFAPRCSPLLVGRGLATISSKTLRARPNRVLAESTRGGGTLDEVPDCVPSPRLRRPERGHRLPDERIRRRATRGVRRERRRATRGAQPRQRPRHVQRCSARHPSRRGGAAVYVAIPGPGRALRTRARGGSGNRHASRTTRDYGSRNFSAKDPKATSGTSARTSPFRLRSLRDRGCSARRDVGRRGARHGRAPPQRLPETTFRPEIVRFPADPMEAGGIEPPSAAAPGRASTSVACALIYRTAGSQATYRRASHPSVSPLRRLALLRGQPVI